MGTPDDAVESEFDAERAREILARDWFHSHEEDSDDELVYRPASYEFPPARGARPSLRLSGEGAIGVGPGPDDRSLLAPGAWGVEGRRLTVSVESGQEIFEIQAIEPDRLVLRRQRKGQPDGNQE